MCVYVCWLYFFSSSFFLTFTSLFFFFLFFFFFVQALASCYCLVAFVFSRFSCCFYLFKLLLFSFYSLFRFRLYFFKFFEFFKFLFEVISALVVWCFVCCSRFYFLCMHVLIYVHFVFYYFICIFFVCTWYVTGRYFNEAFVFYWLKKNIFSIFFGYSFLFLFILFMYVLVNFFYLTYFPLAFFVLLLYFI